jgi:hypothetical protein
MLMSCRASMRSAAIGSDDGSVSEEISGKASHDRAAQSFDGATPPSERWTTWQREVVEILRRDLEVMLLDVTLEDVDWPAWHRFYLQGKSPRAAVDRALERDL